MSCSGCRDVAGLGLGALVSNRLRSWTQGLARVELCVCLRGSNSSLDVEPNSKVVEALCLLCSLASSILAARAVEDRSPTSWPGTRLIKRYKELLKHQPVLRGASDDANSH